jgi:hypothetical protein
VSRQRYIIQCEKIPQEDRDVYRSFSDPQFFNIKRLADIGDKAVYGVSLTEEEAERAARASNIINLGVSRTFAALVGTSIPSNADLKFHKAEQYRNWGWTGIRMVIGIIDSGLGEPTKGMFSIKAAKAFTGNNPYQDSLNHGTSIAALATPSQSQVVIADVVGGTGGADEESSIAAVYWMVDEIGVNFINYSYGGPEANAAFEDAIDHAKAEGVPFFAATGNSGDAQAAYPARFTNAVAVGALDRTTGKKWPNSNGGADLWVSGVNVHTMDRSGNAITRSGTSASSPIAVWIAASQAGKTNPNGVTPENVTDNLIENPMNTEAVDPNNTTYPDTAAPAAGGVPQFDSAGNPVLDENMQPVLSAPDPIAPTNPDMSTGGVPEGNPDNLPIGLDAMDGLGSLPSLSEFC